MLTLRVCSSCHVPIFILGFGARQLLQWFRPKLTLSTRNKTKPNCGFNWRLTIQWYSIVDSYIIIICFFILDWVKRITWDTLRARIWSKSIQTVGDLSTSFLYHILPLLHHHSHYLVLYRTYTNLTSSRNWDCKDGRSLYKVSHSWIICIWLPAKHLEVSSNTIYFVAPSHIHRSTIGYSYWHCICFSTQDISQYCGSSIGSFSFIMVISPYVGHVCDLYKEIWAYMGGIFIGIIPIHSSKLETSPSLCSNGMVSVLLILLCPPFLMIMLFFKKLKKEKEKTMT